MPLKFLKKCRHTKYNVTSKNLFVISVHHLLDATATVDCTISSESKGQECLDNVCQRLLIQQPEFFGLRYVIKDDELKWIDLERSLSRQLEKHAAGTKIFLRVRHYVTTGVRHLSDEVTRYYYFLQLKSDIYEGKIACDIRTAILLALYCRQAEYDSYQNDKQTKDYQKKSLVLPKNLQGLANDDNLLDSLIAEVLQQNAGIQHLTQTQAEEMYIQCCQQLDGYGEERFHAKDTLGNDLQLGLAINGMIVNADNGRQYFPWKNFNTVTVDKRTIKIEQNKGDGSIVGSFIFSEAEMARYFWKLCIAQHKFFKRYIDEESPSVGEGSINGISVGGAEAGNVSAFSYDFGDSREDLLLEQQQRAIYSTQAATTAAAAAAAAQEYQTLQQQQQQQQLTPHGLLAASSNSSALMMSSSNISLAASHQSGGGGGGGAPGWLNKDYGGAHEYVSSSSHHLDMPRLQSSSCLDLSNNNLHGSNSVLGHNGNNNNHLHAVDAQERERLKAMLPTYRPAPDYETAVQQKYRIEALPGCNYYAGGSQPDVHNAAAYYGDASLLLAAHHYPDVTQPSAAAMMHAQHQHLNAAAAVAASARMAANLSTNAQLAGGGNVYIDLPQRFQIMRTKPPPPYPANRLSSSSTPDLAVSHRPLLGYRPSYVSGSSPDLVSNRNFLNAQYTQYAGGGVAAMPSSSGATMLYPYVSQSYLPHGTFENLNMIEEQPSIVSQLRQSAFTQGATTNQSYERSSPTLPTSGGYQAATPQQQQSQAPAPPAPLQRNAMNGSIEPIYENVPLPTYAPATATAATTASNNNNNTSAQRNTEQRASGSSTHAAGSEAMRSRTSSQPPVPAARHQHQHQQQQQQQQQANNVNHNNNNNNNSSSHHQHAATDIVDEVSMNIKKYGGAGAAADQRATSSELQFHEPTPQQRAMRAASAAPNIGGAAAAASHQLYAQTPPPRQHKNSLMKAASSITAVDVIPAAAATTTTMSSHVSSSNNSTMMRHSASHDDSLQQQFGALNLSGVSSGALYANSSSQLDTTASTTTSAGSSATVKEPKRKRRWNILGRSKTPDKQKSATLGREKANTSSNAKQLLAKTKMAQDDLNLTHRWSTGVQPKLQPISGQYSKDKLCQILDEKLNDAQLFMEFEAIPKRRDLARYDCALMEENAHKNADPNFLPYDDNRVRITPTMNNRPGYVNASHISATVGNKQRFYIVAQSPHDELTSHIFWQCVWEADVYLIVQLSEDLNYIPPSTNQRLEFGQFQVYQEFSQTTDRCITSKLRLFHAQSRRYRSVWHLNYNDWAEQNCPRDVSNFLDFLEELNSVRMASIDEVPPGHNTNPPVLIHCLEGGGRSGVTLTADLMLYTLDHNEDMDIPRVIGQLRHQRDSIIPSLAQYKFIYSLLITYLKRMRMI